MLPRRTFLALGAGVACACVGLAGAFAQTTSPTGKWVCPPCGCASDGKVFDAAGVCPSPGCGMTLIPQEAPKPTPAPAPTPTPK